jgi:hypothetical protein
MVWMTGALVLAGGCEFFDARPQLREWFYSIGSDNSPDPTDEIRKKYYRTWPKPMQEAVDTRTVLPGMDKNQVQVALRLNEGLISKTSQASPNGRIEVWTVWQIGDGWSFAKRKDGQETSICFQEGKVVQINRE